MEQEDAEFCVYLVPYLDGDRLLYTCGYCKHSEIVDREQQHVANDGKNYVGELRIIKVYRRTPRRGDWAMLVAGQYEDIVLLSKKDAISALHFVTKNWSYHKVAYWVSPPRNSTTKARWDGLQLDACPVCQSNLYAKPFADADTAIRYWCGSCGFTSNAGT